MLTANGTVLHAHVMSNSMTHCLWSRPIKIHNFREQVISNHTVAQMSHVFDMPSLLHNTEMFQ